MNYSISVDIWTFFCRCKNITFFFFNLTLFFTFLKLFWEITFVWVGGGTVFGTLADRKYTPVRVQGGTRQKQTWVTRVRAHSRTCQGRGISCTAWFYEIHRTGLNASKTPAKILKTSQTRPPAPATMFEVR